MATPVNSDFGNWRYALNFNAVWRCQASSSADWTQFYGASPSQQINFGYSIYYSVNGAIHAFEALNAGNYDEAYAWFSTSVFEALQADAWFNSAKIEWEGPTYMFSGLAHSDLHEPLVWNSLPASCY